MNILWIKDGKIGHEKQVKVLLDEISKTEDITVFEEEFKISTFMRFINIIYYFQDSLSELMLMKHKINGIYDYRFTVYDLSLIHI